MFGHFWVGPENTANIDTDQIESSWEMTFTDVHFDAQKALKSIHGFFVFQNVHFL